MANLSLSVGAGLSTTLGRRSIAANAAVESWNSTVERGYIEARPGAAKIQAALPSDSKVYGFSYGRFGDVEEYVVIARRSGDAKGTLHVLTVDASWPYAVTQYANNTISNSDWQFTQFGEYIYAVNETDGLWRRKIGATTGLEVWQRVNTRFKYDSSGGVDTDDLVERNWGALDVAQVYQTVGSGATGLLELSSIQSDGSWTLTNTTSGNLLGGINYGFWVARVKDSATAPNDKVDFTSARYPGFVLSVADWDQNQVSGPTWVNSVANPVYLYVWDGVTGTGNTPAVGSFASEAAWTANGWKRVVVNVSSPDPLTLVVTGDFDRLGTTVDISRIYKIALGAPFQRIRVNDDYFLLRLAPLKMGGVFLNKPTSTSFMTADPVASYPNQLKPVEYIIQYYNTATLAESTGTKLSLSATDGFGLPLIPNGLRTGNRAKIQYYVGTGSLAPASYDKIRIWRKQYSDSEKWKLIAQVANADGTLVDARVDAANDIVSWGVLATRTDDNEFAGTTEGLAPRALGVWQGHMVLAVGTEVYMSYGGAPDLYIPPARDLPQLFDVDDPTLGRTLYMSYDQSDKVVGVVPDDLLYLIGERGVYVMVGDSAITATPPRSLPGSRGAFGPRAFCKFSGGVVVANEEGIDFHSGSRALAAGSDSIYTFERLTSDIERTYKRFTSNSSIVSDMVLREWQGELYAILDNKFLKRTRAGTWEDGAWAEGAFSGADYAGAGGPASSGGVYYADDPGVGAPWPAGPYPDPNNPPSSRPSSVITGSEIWKAGLVRAQIDAFPGIENASWDTGIILATEDAVGRPGDRPNYSVVDAYGASGRGFRAMSFNGTFIQVSYSEGGVAYMNDCGHPIPWLYQSKDFELDAPYRHSLSEIFVNSLERKASSEPLRIVLTSTDGINGISQQYYEIASGTNFPKQKVIRPGSRWSVIVAGRSASQVCERIELELIAQGTRGT